MIIYKNHGEMNYTYTQEIIYNINSIRLVFHLKILNKIYMCFKLKIFMSIFGKNKKKDNVPAPPTPNGGFNDIKEEISSNNKANTNTSSMPPAPSNSNGSNSQPPTPPSFSPNSNVESSVASAPPNFSSNASGPNATNFSQQSVNQGSFSNNQISTQGSNQQSTDESVIKSSNSVLDESLFNLEDFELPDLDDLDSINHQNSKVKSNDDLNLESKKSINDNSTSNGSSTKKNDLHQEMESQHKNSQFVHESDFLPTKGLSHSKDDTYFLTTSEFKHLLELIDTVKDRIKTSGQRHMKITSIKAEEDIEYDNMKKDFQFIEDKLYEVDSTIFDR